MQNTKGRWGFLTAIAAMFSSIGAGSSSEIKNPYINSSGFSPSIPRKRSRNKSLKHFHEENIAFLKRVVVRRAAAKAARKARRITRQFAH